MVALAEGLRESTESWADLLRDCRRRVCATQSWWSATARWACGRPWPRCSPQPSISGAGFTRPAMSRMPCRSPRSRARRRRCRRSTTPRTGPTQRRRSKGSRGPTVPSGPRLSRRSPTMPRNCWRSTTSGLGPRTHHQPHRVDVLHRQTPHQSHPRRRQPGRRARHGVQARRVSPGPLASREYTPPRRPRPSRSPLRTRLPRGTAADDRSMNHE